MTPEQKDAVGIRTIRSRQNLLAHLAYLRAEARYIGKRMASLSMLLQDEPMRIQFEDAKFPALYSAASRNEETQSPDLFNTRELDGNSIAALAEEIRSTTKEIEALESEIKGMNLQ